MFRIRLSAIANAIFREKEQCPAKTTNSDTLKNHIIPFSQNVS
jgi:hypothetical protein